MNLLVFSLDEIWAPLPPMHSSLDPLARYWPREFDRLIPFSTINIHIDGRTPFEQQA